MRDILSWTEFLNRKTAANFVVDMENLNFATLHGICAVLLDSLPTQVKTNHNAESVAENIRKDALRFLARSLQIALDEFENLSVAVLQKNERSFGIDPFFVRVGNGFGFQEQPVNFNSTYRWTFFRILLGIFITIVFFIRVHYTTDDTLIAPQRVV